MGWLDCFRARLPVIADPTTPSRLPFSVSFRALFDDMQEYTDHDKSIVRARFMPLIDHAEREAARADSWDTVLFYTGFVGSILVTIAASVNQAGYISNNVRDIMNFCILLLSSIGTAAVGMREKLKFREKADVFTRFSSRLQKRGFLFVSRAPPFDTENRTQAFVDFVRTVERLKLQADTEQRAVTDEGQDPTVSTMDTVATMTATPRRGTGATPVVMPAAVAAPVAVPAAIPAAIPAATAVIPPRSSASIDVILSGE